MSGYNTKLRIRDAFTHRSCDIPHCILPIEIGILMFSKRAHGVRARVIVKEQGIIK